MHARTLTRLGPDLHFIDAQESGVHQPVPGGRANAGEVEAARAVGKTGNHAAGHKQQRARAVRAVKVLAFKPALFWVRFEVSCRHAQG